MSLWWLQPGWKAAACQDCGVNIWDAGGDPDHGVCPECFDHNHSEPEPPSPLCDICSRREAVAGVNGYSVCSEECAHSAEKRESPETGRIDGVKDSRLLDYIRAYRSGGRGWVPRYEARVAPDASSTWWAAYYAKMLEELIACVGAQRAEQLVAAIMDDIDKRLREEGAPR